MIWFPEDRICCDLEITADTDPLDAEVKVIRCRGCPATCDLRSCTSKQLDPGSIDTSEKSTGTSTSLNTFGSQSDTAPQFCFKSLWTLYVQQPLQTCVYVYIGNIVSRLLWQTRNLSSTVSSELRELRDALHGVGEKTETWSRAGSGNKRPSYSSSEKASGFSAFITIQILNSYIPVYSSATIFSITLGPSAEGSFMPGCTPLVCTDHNYRNDIHAQESSTYLLLSAKLV